MSKINETKEMVISLLKKGLDLDSKDLPYEKSRIKHLLGDRVYELLQMNNAILSGGALTSIMTGKDINDFDIYFRSENDLLSLANDIYAASESSKMASSGYFSLRVNELTGKSIMCSSTDTDQLVQLILFKYFDSINSLFESFDFTCCMGAFDFSTESFVFHDDFLRHCAQKHLKFNDKTDFPIYIYDPCVKIYGERVHNLSSRTNKDLSCLRKLKFI